MYPILWLQPLRWPLAVIEESGQDAQDDALVAAWDELHPEGAAPEHDTGADGGSGSGAGRRRRSRSLADAVGMMPYDFSPARLRCMELAVRLGAAAAPAP